VFLRHPSTTDDLLVRVLPETDANDAVAVRNTGTVELEGAGWGYSCISLFFICCARLDDVLGRHAAHPAVFHFRHGPQRPSCSTGDGCHHEPKPAVCDSPRSVVDMGEMFHAFWSNLLSALFVYLVLSMFNKAEFYEVITTDQKERLRHKWR